MLFCPAFSCQGTILDRIDYNVEQVVHNTAQANVQLRKAEENQRSGRAAKCIMFLMVTIFFLVRSSEGGRVAGCRLKRS